MENITLRKISSLDLVRLQVVGIQTFTETFAAINSGEDMAAYLAESFASSKLKSELDNPDSEFYFAEIDGRAIGYLKINVGTAQIELKHENALEIERIYVLQDFLGKRVGQLLYEKALEIARHKRVDFVWLGVWEGNDRAIRFYKKNGFKEFDKHIFRLGEDEQIDIMMKLDLISKLVENPNQSD